MSNVVHCCVQEKWANFHGSWGKRSGTEPDYEDYEAAIEQLLPLQQVSPLGYPVLHYKI